MQYIPGINSSFTTTEIFNTGGAVLHWKPATLLDLAAGYSYTRATKANGITSSAQYQQFNLSEYYSLSKRTGLYALQAYQRANGKTLGTNGAAASSTRRHGRRWLPVGAVFVAQPVCGGRGYHSPVLIG